MQKAMGMKERNRGRRGDKCRGKEELRLIREEKDERKKKHEKHK